MKLHQVSYNNTSASGFNMESVKYQGLNLEVWDLGGQTNLRHFWKNYFTQTDIILFVVDSNDKKRLDIVKREIFELDENSELFNVPFCILANKQDIKGAMNDIEVRYNFY